MSDKTKVLQWLSTGQPLDPATAWKHLGIYRLGARIHELRQEGKPITTEIRQVVGMNGKRSRIAIYRMEGTQ